MGCASSVASAPVGHAEAVAPVVAYVPPPAGELRFYSQKAVRPHHSRAAGIWCIIRARVYDITFFLDRHPGGSFTLMLNAAGVDATNNFLEEHAQNPGVDRLLQTMLIGHLVPDGDERDGHIVDPAVVRTVESSPLQSFRGELLTPLDPLDPLASAPLKSVLSPTAVSLRAGVALARRSAETSRVTPVEECNDDCTVAIAPVDSRDAMANAKPLPELL